jgi:single-strand DNA-binding protein
MDLNKVMLIGRVGQDPDVRFTKDDTCILSFSLATTEKWEGKDGKQEKTEWSKIDVFGKLATALKPYIKKGSKLYVEGKLVYDTWEDKQGNKRITAKIRVSGFGSTIIMLDDPNGKRNDAPANDHPSDEKYSDAKVADDSDIPF